MAQATSALDNHSEAVVQQAIDAITTTLQLTTIVIALGSHRARTLHHMPCTLLTHALHRVYEPYAAGHRPSALDDS
jgi:ABC-type bacteriocin/lantibiotic exporter with double-glycine peptidase domain